MKNTTFALLLALGGTLVACAEETLREPAESQDLGAGAGGVEAGFSGFDSDDTWAEQNRPNKHAPNGGGCGQKNDCVTAPGTLCEPHSLEACYEGPADTDGVGTCTQGVRRCNSFGTAYSPCMGQVLPRPDDCSQPTQSVCDGSPPPCHALVSSEVKGISGHQIAAVGQTGSVRGYVDLVSGFELVIERIEDGSVLWSKRFGVTVDDYYAPLRAIAVDDDGSVLLAIRVEGALTLDGQTLWENEAVIVKLDASGEIAWSHTLGNRSVYLESLATHNGYVWAAGGFSEAITLGEDSVPSVWLDGFLLNLDRNGSFLWGTTTADHGDELYDGLAVDEAGNSFVGGGFHGCACDFRTLVVRSYDRQGNLRFDKHIPTRSAALVTQVVLDPQDAIYISGRFDTAPVSNGVDFGGPEPIDGIMFLAKLAKNGEPLWGRGVNDSPRGPAIGGYVGIHPDGRVIWVDQKEYGFSFRAFDPVDGKPLWERDFLSDAGCQQVGENAATCAGWGIFGFAMFPDGSFEIGGSFRGHLDIGGPLPLAMPDTSGFFARYTP